MEKPSVRSVLFAACIAMAPLPAAADPSVGFGFNYIFGGEVSVGLRIFSTDEPEKAAGALGLDYVFNSQRVRPTVGIAYLDDDVYLGLDMGYNFNTSGVDFSIGLGVVDTDPPAGAGGGPTTPVATAASGTEGPSLMSF